MVDEDWGIFHKPIEDLYLHHKSAVFEKDLLDVEQGVIAHQVNCQGKIGAGVSGAIIKKYPEVYAAYNRVIEEYGSQGCYGLIQKIPVYGYLTVVNIFSQYDYGNPVKTGRVYTNIDILVRSLETLVRQHGKGIVWIPYGIGCGYGGESWGRIWPRIENLGLCVALKRPPKVIN